MVVARVDVEQAVQPAEGEREVSGRPLVDGDLVQ